MILNLTFLFFNAIAQDKLDLIIQVDTILMQNNFKIIVPIKIYSEKDFYTILYNGESIEKNLVLNKKSSPLTYEIFMLNDTSLFKNIRINFIDEIKYFIKYGHSSKTRVNRIKVSKIPKKIKLSSLNCENIKEFNLEIDLTNEICNLKCKSLFSVQIYYSLFYYKDKLVFTTISESQYANFVELNSFNYNMEKLILGNFKSNKVVVKNYN